MRPIFIDALIIRQASRDRPWLAAGHKEEGDAHAKGQQHQSIQLLQRLWRWQAYAETCVVTRWY